MRRLSEKVKLLLNLEKSGVKIFDPDAVYVEGKIKIGPGTVIMPFVFLRNVEIGRRSRIEQFTTMEGVRLGEGCVVEENNKIRNCVIGNKTRIKSFSYLSGVLESVRVASNCIIGPMAQILDSRIGEGSKVEFTAQVKRSRVGKNFKMCHHGYLGDALVGDGVNFSAGCITCNFDGKKKYATIIGNLAFIGSNVNLIAPLKIGQKCIVGAGSTIPKETKTGENQLIISRTKKVAIKMRKKK